MLASRSQYTELLAEIKHDGKFRMLPTALLRSLGPDGAVLLMLVINSGSLKADTQGWMLATAGFVQNGAGIPAHEQETLIERLQAVGLLESRGTNGSRHLRADAGKVRLIIDGKLDVALPPKPISSSRGCFGLRGAR